MRKFDHIVCATDFSEPSLEAVEYARNLATRLGAKLTLLHVIEGLPLVGAARVGAQVATINLEEYQNSLREEAKAEIQKLAEKQRSSDLSVETAVVEGKASEQIVKHAEHESADLVVIATHGHSGWKRFLFGAVAEKVVRSAACPVLSVSPEQPD